MEGYTKLRHCGIYSFFDGNIFISNRNMLISKMKHIMFHGGLYYPGFVNSDQPRHDIKPPNRSLHHHVLLSINYKETLFWNLAPINASTHPMIPLVHQHNDEIQKLVTNEKMRSYLKFSVKPVS